MNIQAGDRIEMIHQPEDPAPIEPGTLGTVEWRSGPHDLGDGSRFHQLSVKWDNGRTLMVCIPPDRVRVVNPK